VRPLTSTKVFLESLGQTAMLFPSACAEPASSLPTTLTDDEKALAEAASREPKHGDELAAAAGLSAGAAATALLTLALENVLVEGPGGFYRRTGP
jgi:predicted Rossmann fold nucleotide-binding protein DprA/Smf involved in DNA uptake